MVYSVIRMLDEDDSVIPSARADPKDVKLLAPLFEERPYALHLVRGRRQEAVRRLLPPPHPPAQLGAGRRLPEADDQHRIPRPDLIAVSNGNARGPDHPLGDRVLPLSAEMNALHRHLSNRV